ncbi:MAG: penicillin-binding protein 1A [Burkholderiales bacterium]
MNSPSTSPSRLRSLYYTFRSTRPLMWLRWAAFALLGGAVLGAITLTATLAWLWPSLPPLDKAVNYQPIQHLQVVSHDGVELAQFGSERRIFVPISDIPQQLQNAVLAIEDARFREHQGVDWIGVLRAVLINTGNAIGLAVGRPQGASTITQQVARNFFLSSRRTLERKLKEALLAWRMERELSKDEILELYMNQIYLGHRAYGFGAAAQVYFGKTLEELSVAESAMLAGLPKNPAYANPITNAERARHRQLLVLKRMLDLNMLTSAQWSQAREEPLKLRGNQPSTNAPALRADHVAELARQIVFERYGQEAYTRGLKVTTTLLAADQQAAWSALRAALLSQDRQQAWRGPEDFEPLPDDPLRSEAAAAAALKELRDHDLLRLAIVLHAHPKEVVVQLASGETVRISGDGLRWVQAALAANAPSKIALRRGAIIRVIQNAGNPNANNGWAISQWPQAQAAFVALDPQTGHVRALVGSFDFARQSFNHATQAWRQPGSTLKPFIYSAAFEHGVMPDTVVNDAPLLNLSANDANAWNPRNADGQYEGPITVRRALAQSKNLVSLRLLQHVGVGPTKQWLARFGFDLDRQPDNLSLALGTGSTTPMQMATAYAALANGGHTITPVMIEKITDAQGQVLFQAPPLAPFDESKRVVSERNAYLTRQLLQEVTQTGSAARAQKELQRPDLYGKTGTTNAAADVWFAGFQPTVVAVVWMGHDEPRSLGNRASGSSLALPPWISYMKAVLRDVPIMTDAAPDGLAPRQGVFGHGEWVYEEWAEGGGVRSLGLDAPADANATPPDAPLIPSTVATPSPAPAAVKPPTRLSTEPVPSIYSGN